MSSLSKQAAALRTLLERGSYRLNDIAEGTGDPTFLDTLRQAAESLEWLDRNNVKIRPVLTEVRRLFGTEAKPLNMIDRLDEGGSKM